MISIQDLALRYGNRYLFEHVDLLLQAGRRYGIVGANGTGKSTFLRILAGQETPSEGAIEISSHQKIGLLKQNQFEYESQRILDVVLQGNAVLWEALQEKEKLLQKVDFTEEDGFLLGELEVRISEQNGYGAEAVAHEILMGLGIVLDFHLEPLSSLSGGYKLRVLLAQVLFSSPDILLLDEPTNHLDVLSIHWLERFLQNYRGVILIVSHDRHFLNTVSTEILDIDYETITRYVGNYDDFLFQKEANRSQRESENKTKEKKIEQLEQFVERFGSKASKASQASSKQKQIDKIKLDELKRTSRIVPAFRFKVTQPSGKQPLIARHCMKSFGEKKVLSNVSLLIRRGERVALIGPNGMGKSTLLKILVGSLQLDSGEFEWGHEAKWGYLAQDHHEQLDPQKTLLQWLTDEAPPGRGAEVRSMLGMMLFSGSAADKHIRALSGGEATRLLFARIMLMQPNVLILDEPTNHLDMEAIDGLVAGLKNYTGTVLVVSHDRYFVSQVATRVVALTPKGIQDLVGSYDDFLDHYQKDYLER